MKKRLTEARTHATQEVTFDMVKVNYKGKKYLVSGEADAILYADAEYDYSPQVNTLPNGDPGYPEELDFDFPAPGTDFDLDGFDGILITHVEADTSAPTNEQPTEKEVDFLNSDADTDEFDDVVMNTLTMEDLKYDIDYNNPEWLKNYLQDARDEYEAYLDSYEPYQE